MKTIKFLLSTVLLALASNTLADNLTVEDFTIAPGGKKTVSINLENPDKDYIMLEFWMSLPEGVTIPKDDDDYFMAEGNASRFTRTHSLEVALQDGYYHFLIFSTRNEAVKEKSGELISLTLEASAEMADGTYEAKIINQLYNDTEKNEIRPADVAWKIIVAEETTDWVTLDETSTTLPDASDGEVNVKVLRTIKGGEWSTLCLPFDMTETQLRDAFGSDVQLAEFVDYEETYDEVEENIVGIKVNFASVDIAAEGLYANFPYLIKTSADISEFTATAIIDPDEDNAVDEYDNGKKGRQRKVFGTFYGTLHSGHAVPEGSLFLSGNKFWYSAGKTTIKAFRGYFTFDDVLSSASSANVSFAVEDLDGIATLTADIQECHGIYDLQGRRVAADVYGQAKKGIYIINGKKKVIK